MKRILAVLMALAFAASANASGQGEGPTLKSYINFDSLETGDYDISTTNNWRWESTSADDDLRVTAWVSGVYTGDRPENGGDTNYLKIETEFSTPLYRGAVGFKGEGTTPNQWTIKDQLYFDSLVYLTPGDPTSYVDSLPVDAKIAVWLQEAEEEDGEPVLCVRAGYRAAETTTENSVKTYKCEQTVSTGWHRLTIRCFANVMWTSGSATLPAYVVYLDGKALTTAEARFEEGMVDVDGMVPKCQKLNTAGALFLPIGSDKSTSVGAVGFAGSGAVDDIIFTETRPNFLTADDDINYFRLSWDKNVTAASYIVNTGTVASVSDFDNKTYEDIALADGAQTDISVLATYKTNFGPGDWTATGATYAPDPEDDDVFLFTVLPGSTTPSGKIVSASTISVAEATVTINGNKTTLQATTLSALADAISAALQPDGAELPESAEVYIKLVEDQDIALYLDSDGYLVGQVALGTAKLESEDSDVWVPVDGIVWTLDLNGKTITVEGSIDDAPIRCDGKLTVADTSEAADGAIVRSDANLQAICNQGDLTIDAGRFVGRIVNDSGTSEAVFNGGKYAIGKDTGDEYLKFLNGHKGTAVVKFVADSDTDPQYYVVSDEQPEPAVVVAKIGDVEYETIQAAFDAAVKAEGETTVDVVSSVEIGDSLFIVGSGIDTTKIAVNVADGVTVTSTADYCLCIDGATVTLGGAGQWVNKANGTLVCVGEKSAAAHLVVGGATLIAKAGEEAGSGIDGAGKVINVQNGAVTVKSGLIKNDYIWGCCVRSENSEVAGVSAGTEIVVEGGTLTVPTTGNYAPVIVKSGSSTEINKIYISVDGGAKFAGPEAKIVGAGTMEDYLAVKNESSGEWEYTDKYEFTLGDDSYYTIVLAYEPVDAGSATTCDDEAAADALKAAIEADKENMIKTPSGAGDGFDKSAYVGLFEVTSTPSEAEAGKYVVAVVLTGDATTTIQKQVDAYGKLNLSALATEEQTATLETTPGIFYTVFYGTTPTAITSHGASVLAKTAETALTYPTQGAAGFYRVKATVQPVAAE